MYSGGWAQKGFRPEAHIVALAGDEDPAHFGGHAIDQPGGEERAAADADIAIHSGQIDPVNASSRARSASSSYIAPIGPPPATGRRRADVGAGVREVGLRGWLERVGWRREVRACRRHLGNSSSVAERRACGVCSMVVCCGAVAYLDSSH